MGEEKTRALKVDCDWCPPGEWVREYVERVIPLVLGDSVQRVSVRKSRHDGLHFVITIRNQVDPLTLCRLQFLLGDDRHRCRMNHARIVAGMGGDDWNRLFAWSRTRRIRLTA